MNIKVNMTKQEFNQLVKERGYDYVHKLIVGDKKDVRITILANHVVVQDFKKSKKPFLKKLKEKCKKIKGERKDKWNNRLKEMAHELNKNEPASEKWFKDLFDAHYSLKQDFYNKPFKKRYIPDVLNYKFKYIIEIDGSIHNTPEQIEKDKKKDIFYKRAGFIVFRVKAFSNESYINLIKELIKIRGHYSHPKQSFRDYLLTLNIDYSTMGF